MAPIRRYLRITKYSVLEVRIYLDNPSLAHSWLLNPRNPILPRVITAVRPLVLPKLREENERAAGGAKGKGKKKKGGVKDVVVEGMSYLNLTRPEAGITHRTRFPIVMSTSVADELCLINRRLRSINLFN